MRAESFQTEIVAPGTALPWESWSLLEYCCMTTPYDDRAFVSAYLRYQERYRTKLRESDKRILELISGRGGRLLDVGCSSGNLLRALRDTGMPLELDGLDISEDSIAQCRGDPSLSGIGFRVGSIFDLPKDAYDVVISNAVLYCLLDFNAAVTSVRKALRDGGLFVAFDFFHPFEQEIEIVERTQAAPEGHQIFMRSMFSARAALIAAGFADVAFHPFAIPITLNGDGIATRTVESDVGRLQFRGAIYQPWCHLVAHA